MRIKESNTVMYERIQEFGEGLEAKYSQAIFATAYKIMHNEDNANDVTQETLMKLIKLSKKLYGMDKKALRVYISRAAFNNTLTFIKKNPEMLSWEAIAESNIIGINKDIVVSSIEQREVIVVLLECINLLSERQRDLILFKFFDDLDNKMIADMLGISTGGVRILQKRALDKLRKLLQARGIDYYE